MASNIRRAFLSVVLLVLCSSGAIAQTTWAPGATSPIKRYESPAVTLNGKVYIFGGFHNLTPTGVLEATPRSMSMIRRRTPGLSLRRFPRRRRFRYLRDSGYRHGLSHHGVGPGWGQVRVGCRRLSG